MAQFAGVQLLLLACFVGLATLSVQLCGRRFPAFVTFCMFNGYAVVVEWGVRSLLSLMMPSVVQTDELVSAWASPLYRLGSVLMPNGYELAAIPGYAWQAMVVYALVGVACAVLAGWLFCRRDVERAGDGFAFPQVHAVTIVLFSVVAGIGLALVVLLVCGLASMDTTGMLVAPAGVRIGAACAIVILSTVVCLVTERVLGHDLASIRRHPSSFLATLAASVVLAIACTTDVTGVVRYVPDAEDVANAQVSEMQLSFTGEDGVRAVRDLHQALIDSSGAGDRSAGGQNSWSVFISYRMKDYTSVARSYDVAFPSGQAPEPGTAAYALDEFLRSEAVCQRVVTAAEDTLLSQDHIPQVQLSIDGAAGFGVAYEPDGTESIVADDEALAGLVAVDAESYPSLLEAIKEDVAANGAWCLMPYDENAAIVGDVFLTTDSVKSDAFFVYLSEERTPATLAWAQDQAS